MKNAKKLYALMLCFILMATLVSCKRREGDGAENAEVNVPVSSAMQHAVAKPEGGDSFTSPQGLKYSVFETETDRIVVMLTNTLDYTIKKLMFTATFTVSGRDPVVTNGIYFAVPKGAKIAIDLKKPWDNSSHKYLEYSDFQVDVEAVNKKPDFKFVGDTIKTNATYSNGYVVIECTNNGKETADINYKVLFYKNNGIVGCSEGNFSDTVSPGMTESESVRPPIILENEKYISFDSYEVLLTEAYTRDE